MRLFLFSASIFFLLGLKLTSQFELRSSLNGKPEIKHQIQPPELKPGLLKKDSLILPETKSIRPAGSSIKAQKRNNPPQS